MFRKTLLLIANILLVLAVVAQSDSRLLYDSKHKVDTLDGFYLHHYTYSNKDLFNSNQNIYIVELQNLDNLKIKFAHREHRTKTSEIAISDSAIIAINGSFFDMDKHFPVCFLRIDSVNVGENTPGIDTINRKYYQYGTICIDNDSLFILKTDSLRRWEEQLPYQNIMTAGPLLILNHENQSLRNDRKFVTQRHNRTALGIKDNGTILLLVADGRFSRAEGLTLFELQELMQTLGCRDAINLDGGGSSTLFLNTDTYNGVINYPSDNNKFDHNGERGVSNAVLVIKK